MGKSKHRRKGKKRPRGQSRPLDVPPSPPPPEEAAQNERFDAFLQQTGRTQDQLSHAEWHDALDSQAWRDWKGQHPLPNDEYE